jgi:hypothetical protein
MSKRRFMCSQNGHVGPPPPQIWQVLSSKWLAYFEHVFWTQYRRATKASNQIGHVYLSLVWPWSIGRIIKVIKVDGLNFVIFVVVCRGSLKLDSQGWDFVHPCMYVKPRSTPYCFGRNLKLSWSVKVHWQWGVRRSHRFPSIMLTTEPKMAKKL